MHFHIRAPFPSGKTRARPPIHEKYDPWVSAIGANSYRIAPKPSGCRHVCRIVASGIGGNFSHIAVGMWRRQLVRGYLLLYILTAPPCSSTTFYFRKDVRARRRFVGVIEHIGKIGRFNGYLDNYKNGTENDRGDGYRGGWEAWALKV